MDDDLAFAQALQLQEIFDSEARLDDAEFGSSPGSYEASGSGSGSARSDCIPHEDYQMPTASFGGFEFDEEEGGRGLYYDDVGLECEICQETKPVDCTLELECKHVFCVTCLSEHAKSQAEQNNFPIKCPSYENNKPCGSTESSGQLVDLLEEDLHNRALAHLAEMSISEDERFFCPYKNCSALMALDPTQQGSNASHAVCGGCRRPICISCNSAWHEGATCAEYQSAPEDERDAGDFKLKNLANSSGWKRCPTCRHWVERTEGCPHMTCRCKAEFCYKCGEPWVNKKPTCTCFAH